MSPLTSQLPSTLIASQAATTSERAPKPAPSLRTSRQRRVATNRPMPMAANADRIQPTGYDSRMLPITSVV